MVLEDTAIRNMSLETLRKVMRPKVEGSLHLDQLFQTPRPELDFFIFFSSVGSVRGRPGQANYAAANLFMTAMAERRRRRGQAASVMHIGPIFGTGYLNQQGLDTDSRASSKIKTVFPLSERDFFEHFAEAVIAGRSKSSPLDTITGLAKLEPTQEMDPLLSHHTQDQVTLSSNASNGKSKVPLKTLLINAQGHAQVEHIIRDAFLQKLSVLFQMELSKLEQTDAKTLRLDEMGIDSLLAVEIRGWFVNALQVNIPVLKILSGTSVADLIEIAVDTIPRELVPKLDHKETDATLGDSEKLAQNERKSPIREPCSRTVTPLQNELLVQSSQLGNSYGSMEMKTPNPASDSSNSYAATPPRDQQAEGMANGNSCDPLSTSSPVDDSGEFGSLISTPRVTTMRQNGLRQSPSRSSTPEYTSSERNESSVSTSISEDEKTLELSFSQSLFWFSREFSDDPRNLNLTLTFRLSGEIDIERLETALLALGRRHESLRTRFTIMNGRPMQGIMSTSAMRLERYAIRSQDELGAYTDEIHNHVYELESGRTVRLALVSMSSKQHFFIMGLHHLAMDGQSSFPFMNDLLKYYTNSHHMLPPTTQYAEYSQAQHQDHVSGRFTEDLAFWKAELGDMPPALPLLRTSDLTSRPRLEGYGNRLVDLRVERHTKALIQSLCRRCRVTPFHFYLAVFRVLLYRYTGSKHFSVGVGDANRMEESLVGSIGDFLNMLPLVFQSDGSLSFDEVVQETRVKIHEALAHSRLPFQVLLNE